MSRRTLLSLLLLGAAIALGALREFLFVNLNYQLDFLQHARDRNYAHSVFRHWTAGWDAADALRMKWLLAAAFVAAMAALTVSLARVRLGDHRLRGLILGAYALLAAAALAGHAAAPAMPALRPIGIAVLHALQYPVPLVLVWVLSWLQRS